MNERLKNFPISFFVVPMSLAGAAITRQPMESGFIKQIEMTGTLGNLSRITVLSHFLVLMITRLKMSMRIKYYLSRWTCVYSSAALTLVAVINRKICVEDSKGGLLTTNKISERRMP
jgi:hypothetical protein